MEAKSRDLPSVSWRLQAKSEDLRTGSLMSESRRGSQLK